MWLMRSGEDEDGELFGHQLVNGIFLVGKQYWFNFFKYRGFEDITPEDWLRSFRKPKNVQKVLHVHYGGIGDVLFITAIIKAYKRIYPESRHTVSTSRASAQLLFGNPAIEGFLLDEQQHIGHYVNHFDDAITYDYSVSGNGESTIRNVYDIYADWAGVALKDTEKHPWIHLSLKEKNEARDALKREFGISEDDRLVVIQFESSSEIRNIEREKFLSLASMLVADGYKVLMYGTNDIRNYNITECDKCGKKAITSIPNGVIEVKRKCECGNEFNAIKNNSPVEGVYFLSGMPLRVIASVISFSQAFIGVDSSGLHIAAAFDIPSLGLFSSFDANNRLKYYPKASEYQLSYRCAPCYQHVGMCSIMINQGLSTAPCMSNFLTNNIKLMFDRLIAGDIHKTREMVNQIIPEDCVVCAGTNVNNFITKKGRVSYYECSECGAVMSNKAVDLQIDLENDARWKPLENDFYRKLQYDIADHIFEKISKKEFCVTKVLEIGPGNGHLAKRITSDKLVAYTGLDISDMACSYVREKCSDASVIIENKNFYQYTTEEKYHVIILDKSLECFGYPVEVLKKIKNMLHKNGMIVMVLHNTDNWKKFDNHWPAINTFLPGENAVLYNYRSIEIISTLYGFKIIEVEELNEADFMMVTLENNVESEG